MIVKGGTTLWKALCSDWPALVFFLFLAMGAEALVTYFPLQHTALPFLPLGMLITAMSIFLGFQINQSYERWWEARVLWGRLVNVSRSFGRQITTLMTADRLVSLSEREDAATVQREILYRHIAYVNALCILLRSGGKLNNADCVLLAGFLAPEELGRLRSAANPTTQLIQHQGRRLSALCSQSWTEQQILLTLDESLNQLYDIQGGCERIKRQAFPDRFTFHTRLFVWLLALLIPFNLFQETPHFDVIAVVTKTFLSFIFVTIERLGGELRDPFENQVNDTPMTALSRIIEIDLRQQLGETDIPPPLQAVNGVLM